MTNSKPNPLKKELLFIGTKQQRINLPLFPISILDPETLPVQRFQLGTNE